MNVLAWMLAGGLCLFGCAGGPQPIPQQPPSDRLQATAFRCPDGFRFAVHWTADGEQAAVLLPNATAFLTRDLSGSGARYTAPRMTLWVKGDEALLDLGQRQYRGCKAARPDSLVLDAAYRGVSFRGAGNEPPWVFEMGRQMMIVVIGYDRQTLQFPVKRVVLPPVADQPAPAFHKDAAADGHRLRLEAAPADCRDTMSGRRYPYRVRISLDDRILRGCGEWLAPPTEVMP